jgi:hypothetical protein
LGDRKWKYNHNNCRRRERAVRFSPRFADGDRELFLLEEEEKKAIVSVQISNGVLNVV